VDPAHHESTVPGNSKAERIYLRAATGELCPVDILHEHGGTFLGIPLSEAGAPRDRSNWRRSNIREEVVRAIQGVLSDTR
jgi:hypothetical protein